MPEMPALIVHPAYNKTAVLHIFAGSWADKLGYEGYQGPSEAWGKSELYCPGCGVRGLWCSLEGLDTAICTACGGRYDIRCATPTLKPAGFTVNAHLERLAKLRLAEADIEIRIGAGTKKYPHQWLPAIAGRQTSTRLYYRWPDDPPTWERGPVRLDCQGLTWRKLEQEDNPCQTDQTEK